MPESQTSRSFLQAGDIILVENIKLIDVIKEINCRKNKLLIGAIEKFENGGGGGGDRSWTNSEDWFVPLVKRFPGLPK